MDYVEDCEVSHVVDSHHGIYSAQEFAYRWGEFLSPRKSFNLADIDILRNGPDDEHYYDAWQSVLDESVVRLEDKEYRIYESEGIYLVRSDVEWCEECEWFKSAECECPHVAA